MGKIRVEWKEEGKDYALDARLIKTWDQKYATFEFYPAELPRMRCRVVKRKIECRKGYKWVKAGTLVKRVKGPHVGDIAVLGKID